MWAVGRLSLLSKRGRAAAQVAPVASAPLDVGPIQEAPAPLAQVAAVEHPVRTPAPMPTPTGVTAAPRARAEPVGRPLDEPARPQPLPPSIKPVSPAPGLFERIVTRVKSLFRSFFG